MRTNKLAAVSAAFALSFGALVVVEVSTSRPALANECQRSGDYSGLPLDPGTAPATNCDGTKTNTGTPKPTQTPKPVVTPKPTPKPQPKPQPAPKPVIQSKPKPRPVVQSKPAPKPVVRQDAKPPAKIAATATKVCVIRVKVTNSGGTTATVHIGPKTVTVAPKKTVTVEVPVRPDGTWSIRVTGPGYSKVFKGGCDCAKTAKPIAAVAASAEIGQNAVPQVEQHFPWLVVFAGMGLVGIVAYPLGRRHGRVKATESAQDEAASTPAQS